MPLPVAASPTPSRKERFRSRGLAIAVLVGLGYLVWAYLLPMFSNVGPSQLPLTALVRSGELKITVSDRGNIESVDAVSVICENQGGGKIMTIVPEGTRVAKGDVVCTLDPDQYLKLQSEQLVRYETALGKVQSAKSDLTQAESKAATEIAKALKTLKLAKIDLESYKAKDGEYVKESEKLKGALELAKKELVEAEEDFEFTKKQLRRGFGDYTAVKSKELNMQQKKYNVSSAQAELTLLENYTRRKKITELEFNAEDAERELKSTTTAQTSAVEKAKNELKSAESTAQIEKATLERIQKQIERCTIKAPSAGIVVYSNSRFWDESARIRPGAQLYSQQEILTLPDLNKLKVKMKVHESVIKKVQTGMSASITMDALPNRVLNGKVLKIATIAQKEGWTGGGVKQYETEISIDDLPSEAGLKPGMSADVKILIRTIPDAISVPVSAITEFEGQRVVYRVTGKTIERVVVEPGESNEQYVQILSGLNVGDCVTLDARSRAAADLKATQADASKKND